MFLARLRISLRRGTPVVVTFEATPAISGKYSKSFGWQVHQLIELQLYRPFHRERRGQPQKRVSISPNNQSKQRYSSKILLIPSLPSKVDLSRATVDRVALSQASM